jgi:hypothetical protein
VSLIVCLPRGRKGVARVMTQRRFLEVLRPENVAPLQHGAFLECQESGI